MDEIGIRELRQNASKYLRRVAGGETLVITDRGRPVARLVPIQPTGGRDALIRSGRLRPAEEPLDDMGPPLPPRPGVPLPSKVLREMRRDER